MAFGNSVSGFLGGQNSSTATAPYLPQGYQDLATQTQNNFNNNYANENLLAQALLNQSNGGGPNPALSQLRQTTNQNAQQAAGMMASNRSLNPGLAARLSSQNLINANQQAGGQAATLSAQQQLGAQSNLAGLYGSMAGQNAENQQVINQGELGAEGINAQVGQANANNAQSASGGLINGVGAGIAGALGFYKGGMIPRYADGGTVQIPTFMLNTTPTAPMSFGSFQKMGNGIGANSAFNKDASELDDPIWFEDAAPVADGATMTAASSGVPAAAALALARGGNVPGKAQVQGNSKKNDTVLAMLSPGEAVLPRSVTQSKNAPELAKEFVEHLMAKKKRDSSKSDGYAKVLEAHRNLMNELSKVQKKGA